MPWQRIGAKTISDGGGLHEVERHLCILFVYRHQLQLSFYEHLGLKRRCEKKQVVDVKGEQGEMTFFLYDYPCEMAKPDGPVGVQEEGLL